MNHTLKNRVVWLCGASSGIGYALAHELVKSGVNLIVSSRDLSRLSEFRGKAYFLKCDVTEETDWLHCQEDIQKMYGRLDTFIYNAGDCEYVDVKDFKSEMFERLMRINFSGLVQGVEKLLPLLRKGYAPHIVGMSSSVDGLAMPRAGAYGSTKAAVSYFLESLRLDLKEEDIDVSLIKPGFVKTPLTDKNDFPMPCLISAEEAGKKIMKGIQKRQLTISFPKRFTWTLRFIGILPPRIRFKLTGALCQ